LIDSTLRKAGYEKKYSAELSAQSSPWNWIKDETPFESR